MCSFESLQDKGLALTRKAISTGKWKKLRITILDRDGWQCVQCGKPGDTVDHIIPVSYTHLTLPTNREV